MEKRKLEKSVPFQILYVDNNSVKKNKNKSHPDFLGKTVPVGRSTRFFLFEGGLSIESTFQGNWLTVNCDHQYGFQFIHIVKD